MKRKLYDRCMGACCEDIGLKISPDQLKDSYIRWLSIDKYNSSEEITMDNYKCFGSQNIYRDIHIVYPAFIFIKENYYHPESPNKKGKEIIYHYTCKHFDSKKRVCTIYDIRPMICRTYPDGGVCNNPKCKWKKQIELRKERKKKEQEQQCRIEKETLETKRGIKKLNESS